MTIRCVCPSAMGDGHSVCHRLHALMVHAVVRHRRHKKIKDKGDHVWGPCVLLWAFLCGVSLWVFLIGCPYRFFCACSTLLLYVFLWARVNHIMVVFLRRYGLCRERVRQRLRKPAALPRKKKRIRKRGFMSSHVSSWIPIKTLTMRGASISLAQRHRDACPLGGGEAC